MNETLDHLNETDQTQETDRVEKTANPHDFKVEDSNSTADGRNIRVNGAVTSSVLVTGNNNRITINADSAGASAHGTLGEVTLNLLTSQIETLSAELSGEKAIHLEE